MMAAHPVARITPFPASDWSSFKKALTPSDQIHDDDGIFVGGTTAAGVEVRYLTLQCSAKDFHKFIPEEVTTVVAVPSCAWAQNDEICGSRKGSRVVWKVDADVDPCADPRGFISCVLSRVAADCVVAAASH